MATTNVQTTVHDLEAAGADPKLATAIAQAIRTGAPPLAPSPTWPIPVIATVLVAAIAFVGAGVLRNGDRIDTLSERVSALEVSMSERMARIETLLNERLPPRQ